MSSSLSAVQSEHTESSLQIKDLLKLASKSPVHAKTSILHARKINIHIEEIILRAEAVAIRNILTACKCEELEAFDPNSAPGAAQKLLLSVKPKQYQAAANYICKNSALWTSTLLSIWPSSTKKTKKISSVFARVILKKLSSSQSCPLDLLSQDIVSQRAVQTNLQQFLRTLPLEQVCPFIHETDLVQLTEIADELNEDELHKLTHSLSAKQRAQLYRESSIYLREFKGKVFMKQFPLHTAACLSYNEEDSSVAPLIKADLVSYLATHLPSAHAGCFFSLLSANERRSLLLSSSKEVRMAWVHVLPKSILTDTLSSLSLDKLKQWIYETKKCDDKYLSKLLICLNTEKLKTCMSYIPTKRQLLLLQCLKPSELTHFIEPKLEDLKNSAQFTDQWIFPLYTLIAIALCPEYDEGMYGHYPHLNIYEQNIYLSLCSHEQIIALTDRKLLDLRKFIELELRDHETHIHSRITSVLRSFVTREKLQDSWEKTVVFNSSVQSLLQDTDAYLTQILAQFDESDRVKPDARTPSFPKSIHALRAEFGHLRRLYLNLFGELRPLFYCTTLMLQLQEEYGVHFFDTELRAGIKKSHILIKGEMKRLHNSCAQLNGIDLIEDSVKVLDKKNTLFEKLSTLERRLEQLSPASSSSSQSWLILPSGSLTSPTSTLELYEEVRDILEAFAINSETLSKEGYGYEDVISSGLINRIEFERKGVHDLDSLANHILSEALQRLGINSQVLISIGTSIPELRFYGLKTMDELQERGIYSPQTLSQFLECQRKIHSELTGS